VATDPITKTGFLALQAELSRLWKVERPRVTEEVSVAAAQGDRSENAEYIYGKKKLREIDRKIRHLTKRLEALTVVEPEPSQLGRIFFGAWFTIEEEDGSESTYRIVGTDELELAAKQISVRSPLARALLGKRVGDCVQVERPRGSTEVCVLRVWYPSAEEPAT
jgi:transcription elongation factor GreB